MPVGRSASTVEAVLNMESAPPPGSQAARREMPLGLLLLLTAVAALVVAVAGPLAGLLLILGVLAVFAAAFMPGVVLGVYLLIGIYKGGIQPYSPVDASVVLAGLNILQVIPVVLDRRPRHVSQAGIILWLTLGLLTLGGILYAQDQGLAIGHVALFWGLAVLPILPAAIRVGSSPRYVRQLLWSFFGMGLPMVVLGLAQFSSSERLVLLGANTLEVARAALLVPLVGISFVLRQRRALATAATIVLIPAAVLVAIASGSRGPLFIAIALGVYASIRYFSRPRQVNWRITGWIAALAFASLVVVSQVGLELPGQSTQRFSLFADFLERGLSGDLNTALGDTSSGIRVQLFGLAVSLFEERPLLGVGPAGFEALSPRYLSPIEAEAYPHNAFLQFAAEYGLVGLAIFGALLVLAATRPLPPSSSLTAVRVLLVFWFLNAMVSGDIFGDRTAWGLLMLLLLIDEKRIAQVEEPAAAAPWGLPARLGPGRFARTWARQADKFDAVAGESLQSELKLEAAARATEPVSLPPTPATTPTSAPASEPRTPDTASATAPAPATAGCASAWATPPRLAAEQSVVPGGVPPEESLPPPRRRQPGDTAPDFLLRTPTSVTPVADDFFDDLIRRVEGDR